MPSYTVANILIKTILLKLNQGCRSQEAFEFIYPFADQYKVCLQYVIIPYIFLNFVLEKDGTFFR